MANTDQDAWMKIALNIDVGARRAGANGGWTAAHPTAEAGGGPTIGAQRAAAQQATPIERESDTTMAPKSQPTAPSGLEGYTMPIESDTTMAPNSQPAAPSGLEGYTMPIESDATMAPKSQPTAPSRTETYESYTHTAAPTIEHKMRQVMKPSKVPDWAKAKGIDLERAALGKEIKSGAFGTTRWLEGDGVGGESLVIKTGKPNPNHAEVLKNCAALAHEAEFYEKIGDHPNIAKCMGIQDVGGERGLVLEGIRGKDMHGTMDRLEKLRKGDKAEMAKLALKKPLSHSEFVGMQQYMLSETLKGLAKLEEVGVVHSDIRPDNIMVDGKTGGVKLIDLGLAVDAGQRQPIAPVVYGSVGPEFAQNRPVTPKYDVFSAGVIAHEGMERDQFRYGEKGQGPATMAGLANFGKANPDGTAKQALNPQAKPETPDKKDYKGRLEAVEEKLDDAYVKSVVADDKSLAVDKFLAIAKEKYRAYKRLRSTGDRQEGPAEQDLDKALAQLEGRLKSIRTTGTYDAETEYTKFVNWAMNPDPTKRPSAKEALAHPFLADSLLDEETASGLMKTLLSDTQS